MKSRRQFLAAAAGLLFLPSRSFAKELPKPWRVGFLASRRRPENLDSDFYGYIPLSLRDLGYVEGRDFIIVWRFAAGDYARLDSLAEELVKLPVDIILADGTPGTKAAQRATKTIPIVFAGGGDVVKDGLVRSLAHPGGNTTGCSLLLSDTAGKQLELLTSAVPGLSRLAVLFNSGNPASIFVRDLVLESARERSLHVLEIGVQTETDIEAGFPRALADRSDALIWSVDAFLLQQMSQIAELSARARLPSVTGYAEYAEHGGLMGYGPNRRDLYRRTAGYAEIILKGAKPGDLPVQQPTKLDLVVNRKTAKALGLTLPPELLVQADRVID